MCRSVVALRAVAFLLLVVAFVACCVGFMAPFWILRLSPSTTTPTTTATATTTTASLAQVPGIQGKPGSNDTLTAVSNDQQEEEEEVWEEEKEVVMRETGNVTDDDRKFEGLWATCNRKFECRCFAQNDFELQKAYPPWHKAAQGLFTFGLVFLLATLLIGGFYLCCRCCKESTALATVLGAFSLIAFLPILLSVIIYGGFAYHTMNIQLFGGGERFLWGYFVSFGGALVALLAALLYFVAGRQDREITIEHEDCETAKMV